MTDFRTSTQVNALARLLSVESDALGDLGRHGAEYVHDLRLAITAHLFDDLAHVFKRVSRLAPLVPNTLLAKLVPAVVPPLVAGRAAGALGVDHPDRIDDLLKRLPAEYLASCAPYLDPRAVAEIAPKLDGPTLVPAARALLAEREYVTAAGFVEFAPDQLVADLVAGIDNDCALVMTGALVYSDAVLEVVVRAIPDSRYGRLFQAALVEEEAAASAMSILSRVSPELRLTLVAAVAPELDRLAEALVRELIDRSAFDPELVRVATEVLDAVVAARSLA